MGVLVEHSSISMTSIPPAATTDVTRLSGNYTATPTDTTTTNTTTRTTTTAMTTTIMTSLCQNGSVQLCPCPSTAPGNQTRGMLSDEGSLDALLYIVVVLLFYAFSIVVLMVKYIRRENKEAYLRQYFDEFVAREQFQSARTRNQICLKTIMDKRADPEVQGYIKIDMAQAQVEAPLEAKVEDDVLFSIPETISELAEDEEEVEFESAEDELFDEHSQTNTSVRTETEQISSLEELRPQGEVHV